MVFSDLELYARSGRSALDFSETPTSSAPAKHLKKSAANG
jgi:hypothetical protein